MTLAANVSKRKNDVGRFPRRRPLACTGKRTWAEGHRTAFTIVELLAVITITGTLIALLLPAIQRAREASRRSTCGGHLQQIGSALAHYESARKSLPMGARAGGIVGLSFWPWLGPYVEQKTVTDQLDLSNLSTDAWGKNYLVDGIVIDVMLCPSSPLPPLYPVLGSQVLMPHYVGIAGASAAGGFPESRINACCVPDLNSGDIAAGGVLVPNKIIFTKAITDGLSKTLAIGECSDYINAPTWKARVDGGIPNGWLAGAADSGTPPRYGVIGSKSSPRQAWNITTIRYPPNMRDYTQPGIKDDHGPNNPLASAHPGGVNGVLADGAVRFLPDSIDLLLLKQLSTRDDGQTQQGL
jgi:type II secretory pathway pseudopilin PulG